MCCETNKVRKEAFLTKLGRNKTFYGWKVVSSDTTPLYGGGYAFHWVKGVVHALTYSGKKWLGKRYEMESPKGIHVYTEVPSQEDKGGWISDYGRKVIKVKCHIDDVVKVGGLGRTEVVLRKVLWDGKFVKL